MRQAEEEGDVPPVSLAEMREVLERIPPALVAAVAKGRIAVTPELVASPSTAFRMPEMPAAPVAEREPTGPRSPPAPRAYSRARKRLDRMRERDSAELAREAPEAPPAASRAVEEMSIVREAPALRAELWSGDEHEEPALSSLLALLNRVARARTEHSDGRVETWARSGSHLKWCCPYGESMRKTETSSRGFGGRFAERSIGGSPDRASTGQVAVTCPVTRAGLPAAAQTRRRSPASASPGKRPGCRPGTHGLRLPRRNRGIERPPGSARLSRRTPPGLRGRS